MPESKHRHFSLGLFIHTTILFPCFTLCVLGKPLVSLNEDRKKITAVLTVNARDVIQY